MDAEKAAFFAETVRRERLLLFRLTYGILHCAADAEDAVSTAVEKTWARYALLRTKEALPAYLVRAAVNAAKSELRRRKRLTALEPLAEVLPAEDKGGQVADYVSHLDEKYAVPLILRFEKELTDAEIARILHLPRGTVSSRISRALKMLREEMNREEDQHER